jgi:hypothetical protein
LKKPVGGEENRNHIASSARRLSATALPNQVRKIPLMATKLIGSDIDYSVLEGGDRSKQRYVEDPFAASARRNAQRSHALAMKTSEWVHHMVRVKMKGRIGEIDFTERGYLKRPYDTERRSILLMTSRQTEKSTTLGNKLLSLCGMEWYQSSLFVTPSATQTKVFSSARIDDIVEISPMIKALTHKSLTWNILEKEFLTKSKIYLRYAFLNADRIRGISVNNIFYDEVQDLLTDVIPVIRESASRFRNAIHVYSGTPKTFDNSIEKIWSGESTMSEWMVPCENHYPWHRNILGMKNIGKLGPVCEKCHKPINPEHPAAEWIEGNRGAKIEGYRICRLMVPWYYKPDFTDKDPYVMWKEILHSLENYPPASFANEIMALSYDAGTKPLTRSQVIACCDDAYSMQEDDVAELALSHQLYGGIDWGTGENAYTVLSVCGYVRGDASLQYVFFKRFDGILSDPEPQMREIIRLIQKFKLKYVGCDYGMGFVQNKKLTSIFSAKRIHQFQYAARSTKKIVYKAALNRSIVFRTAIMSDAFSALHNLKIRLPNWETFKVPYAEDFLSIYAEHNETLRMIKYDKPRSIPDDSFHALIYALIVSFFDHRRPDIIAPIQEAAAGEEAALRIREDAALEEIETHVANDWDVRTDY